MKPLGQIHVHGYNQGGAALGLPPSSRAGNGSRLAPVHPESSCSGWEDALESNEHGELELTIKISLALYLGLFWGAEG